MSDVTVEYNFEGYWMEVNVDCLESLVNDDMAFIIESNNRRKGDNNA